MDCKTAHMLLDIARPWAAELDAAEAGALREHLAGCPACAARAEAERGVDEHLASAIRDVPVPAGPRGRLLARLAGERAACWRRRLLRVSAAAAALALAVALGWYWQYSRRPVLDPDRIVIELDRQTANGPDKVEEWFREQGFAMIAPTNIGEGGAQLNYTLLDSYGFAQFQGVRVPELVFFHQGSGNALARIYVVSDRLFKVDEQNLRPAVGSNHRVQVIPHPDQPHVFYVVIYTGENLKPFFTPPQRAA
jgi:hypothetical protein